MLKLINIQLTLLLVFLSAQASWTQQCNCEVSIISNEIEKASYEFVDTSVYENIEKISETYLETKPISEEALVQAYPKIFKRKDSTYRFTVNFYQRITELVVQRNKVQTKQYADYSFKGKYAENALIETIGYESWGFISVNLKTGLAFYTMGKPLTSNGQTAISYSNYYGEEEIALTNLKTRKQFMISIEGWRTVTSVVYKNEYYLKLVPQFQSQECENQEKYLKIKG